MKNSWSLKPNQIDEGALVEMAMLTDLGEASQEYSCYKESMSYVNGCELLKFLLIFLYCTCHCHSDWYDVV